MDPARSACVLIGVDDYEDLPRLRSVPRNLTALEEALADPAVWGVPVKHRWVVRNPRRGRDVADPIRAAARQAQDTLLVYYAGHGLLDFHDDQLYLTFPDSTPGLTDSALPYETLRRVLGDVRDSVKRRVLMLDCCYSGQVLERMSAGAALTASMIGIEGSYVMTSSAQERRSVALRGKEFTAFTGEFVKVLTEGVAGREEGGLLSLNQVFDEVRRALVAQGMPEPQRQDQNGVGDLPFVQSGPGPGDAGRGSPLPYWTRRRRAVAGVALVAVAAGAWATGAWTGGAWSERPPSAADDKPPERPAGPCGENGRASLAGVSERLDANSTAESQIQEKKTDNLSALSFTSKGQALMLADDEPARFFKVPLSSGTAHISVGEPELVSLKDADGSALDGGLDAEGLAVVGKDTVLVASEDGPTVRAFGMDGKERNAPDVPVPKEFMDAPTPKGHGQQGHTLESLTATGSGKNLFAGMEAPLASDGDRQGMGLVRIQRYRDEGEHRYAKDGQFAYQADAGLNLVELVALGRDRLLALERGYMDGAGNVIRVYELSLRGAPDVEGRESLHDELPDSYVKEKSTAARLLVDLADCPAGDRRFPHQRQPLNPLLDNVEGMALGGEPAGGDHQGRRPLYLLSDNNANHRTQRTRVYALDVRL